MVIGALTDMFPSRFSSRYRDDPYRAIYESITFLTDLLDAEVKRHILHLYSSENKMKSQQKDMSEEELV